MSKQSEAKERQGWVKKQEKICDMCKFIAFDIEKIQSCGLPYERLVNIHCGRGCFATKKTATCNCWEKK